MNVCGPRCGYCGRCDNEPRQDAEPVPFCDNCGRDCLRTLSLAGVGIACSRDCLTKLAEKHEQAMRKVSA
jgi:hypothetical protein